MTVRRIAALATAALVAAAAIRGAPPIFAVNATVPRSVAEAEVRDRDIIFFEGRAGRDAAGARDRMQLGALYLSRARSTGSHSDLLAAEWWARESIRRRSARNGAALVVLASSLMAQHRFREARGAALALVRGDPDRAAYRAMLGEIDLEIGDYRSADTLFRAIPATGDALTLGPRLARWHELHGRSGEARRFLARALDAAGRRKEMPTEQLAWLRLRLGELAARSGHAREAASHFAAGLTLVPHDHRLLAAQARLEYAHGRQSRALYWAERALAQSLEPSMLALLARIHLELGDAVAAADYTRAFDVAVADQQSGFHRDWSLFQLDHGGDVGVALTRATTETAKRRDVHGLDILAWALFRSGRHSEAAKVSERSLSLGTRDALLHFHAGMIARATGNCDAALRHLRDALEINPRFAPREAREARAAIAAMETSR